MVGGIEGDTGRSTMNTKGSDKYSSDISVIVLHMGGRRCLLCSLLS